MHGIKEEKAEATDNIIINTVKKEMDTKFLPNDLDWFHCVRNHKTRKKEKKKDRKKERKRKHPWEDR